MVIGNFTRRAHVSFIHRTRSFHYKVKKKTLPASSSRQPSAPPSQSPKTSSDPRLALDDADARPRAILDTSLRRPTRASSITTTRASVASLATSPRVSRERRRRTNNVIHSSPSLARRDGRDGCPRTERVYLDRWRIFLRLRFKRRVRFFLHLARIVTRDATRSAARVDAARRRPRARDRVEMGTGAVRDSC